MGEMPDFAIGERVDMIAVIEISKDPNGLEGGERYEALFPGEVVGLWTTHVDVKAGEQIWRVPRAKMRIGDTWEFGAAHVDQFIEAEFYDYEAELGEAEDAALQEDGDDA